MRFAFFASVCFILTPLPTAPAAEWDVRLTGIVNLPGYKKAALQDSAHPQGYLLGEGEREYEVEVTAISPADLTVTLNLWTNRNIKLSIEGATNEVGETPTILLQNAGIGPTIWIFQKLCNCTLLQHPQTPDSPFTFHSSTTNRAEALHDLQITFTNNGIIMIPDGEKFVMIGSISAAPILIPRLPEPKSAESNSRSHSNDAEIHSQELIPAGTVDFRGADLNQAFELYGMLIGHRMDRSHGIGGPVSGQLYILTQTPLSKAEAIYAIGTLINWRGVNVVTQSDGSITGVSSSR